MTRECGMCPPFTQAVCRHAFAERWGEKSRCGEGCDHPLDEVAEAWRVAGWTPTPSAPRRPSTVSLTQLKMPRRPKVSAKILRQAELFFKGAK